ncbi:NAD(P)H-dependent FMN reductase [Tamaricihabitans halophyticus]|uniref:NAD(P)H-dependent FMN reductase n=1 Tax=Tamaricihabitans halophyticus TaxID=1262583 RepID=A0A4R2QV42_9PSEU|nr:NAD(P)H-dependent oxidoreductase [Tamaricihabitans halophyticus]TCP50965.1 NAD(P)H-dependent FMN reductase [Tamaricihabitans halophyticus]
MTEQSPLRIAILMGSTRNGRFCPTITGWFGEQAEQYGDLAVDVIDLNEVALPDTLIDDNDPIPPQVEALSARIHAADAFVVITPEYNHSFPAPLKTAIDWFYAEWQAKPVGFVSYGGMSGGLRAVEQLRLVFAEVHAMTVRDGVSFHNYPDQFDEQGQPKDRVGVNGAAKAMLDQLCWWARALRTARAAHPYTG